LKKIAFLFPGQGSQAVGMGQDVYEAYAFVRELFEMASDIVKIDLAKLIFKGTMENLTQTVNLQPALTVVNLSFLTAILNEQIKPNVTAGHSLGEYSALNASGVLTAEDTIRLVLKRGELMHRESMKHKGAMHAIIGLPIQSVQELVTEVQRNGKIVSVANHNTELQIVITGSPDPVEEVSSLAASQGAKTIPLNVSGAWHSELIKGAEEEFKVFLDTASFSKSEIPIIHNVTADTAKNPNEIKAIMAKQLCNPVRWYSTMCKLIETNVETFVEIGPGRVLAGLLKKTLAKDYPAKIYNVNTIKNLEDFLQEITG
jgi:[acyl-carrier-protein] S-malonyltransferase